MEEHGEYVNSLLIGQHTFEHKETYIWKIKQEIWNDKIKVQNALFCSMAMYEDHPFHFLNNNTSNHGIHEVLAVGKYYNSSNQNNFTRCMMALDGSTLYVAFKGKDTNRKIKKSDFIFYTCCSKNGSSSSIVNTVKCKAM